MAIFYGWWIVAASFILGFHNAGTVFYGFTAFMDPLAKEFGWSYTEISIGSSLRGLEMGLFAPLIGIFVDRFGSKFIMLSGSIITGLGMLLLATTNSLAMFYWASLLIGLGTGGCTSVVIMTLVANWFRKKVSLAMGIAASGFGSGGVLVPVIVWMIDSLQWRHTLFVLGLSSFAVGIPIFFLIRSRPEDYGLFPDGRKPSNPPSPPLGIEPGETPIEKTEDIPLKEAIKDMNFWYLNAAEAIRMTILSSLTIHVMPYLNSLGIPRSIAGAATGALALLSVLGRLGFGYLGDTFDKRHMTAAAFTLMTLGLIVFAGFIKGSLSILVFLLLFAPGFGGGMTMRGSLLREYFGTLSYGKILGITMGIGSLAGIVGPVLAGWVYDTLNSYRLIWNCYVVLNIVGTLLILKIKPLRAESLSSGLIRG